MKFHLCLIQIVLFVIFNATAQTASEILTNELAFSTHLFCRIDSPIAKEEREKVKFARMPIAKVNGFIYLNIPDSLVVIHCHMADLGVDLSKRFIVRKVLEFDPIVLAACDESAEDVLIQIVTRAGMSIEVYYPNKKIDIGYGEQVMAYEFLEFKPLGRAKKFSQTNSSGAN